MHATQALGMGSSLLPGSIYEALPGHAGADLGEAGSWHGVLALNTVLPELSWHRQKDLEVKLVVYISGSLGKLTQDPFGMNGSGSLASMYWSSMMLLSVSS